MAQRYLRMNPRKDVAKEEQAEAQRPHESNPQSERYLLQIDRQSKRAFKTLDGARTRRWKSRLGFQRCRFPSTTAQASRALLLTYRSRLRQPSPARTRLRAHARRGILVPWPLREGLTITND